MELKMLAFAILLGLFHILMAVQAATKRRGIKWNLSAREGTQAPLDGIAGRLDRASKNFLETFAFFAAAVLSTQLLGISNSLTVWGSQIYFYARVIYLPLYAFEVNGARSLAWVASLLGLLLVVIALF